MLNQYQQAQFALSANKIQQLPESSINEVAFVGRSNAGKSSALNCLTNQKNLARTSKTPGRTQLINYFALNQHNYLVDLPGYGYASVPDSIKKHWQKLLSDYLLNRNVLRGIVLVVDIRRLITQLDQAILDICNYRDLPAHILLTKADKLSNNQQINHLSNLKKTCNENANISYQLFSSPKKIGLPQLIKQLDLWFM